jgi:prepilin-type N-terminal cleavage/methylation domain-containing protein
MTRKKGFTLVELLIVVLIIGALAAIVIPRITKGAFKARANACRTNVCLMNSQIELYYSRTGSWPAALTDVTENTSYFPDGAPACPFGIRYVMDKTRHRVFHHFHTLEKEDTEVSPQQAVQQVNDSLCDIADNNPGTPLADKIEDAADKLAAALTELGIPDNQAAAGNIEGAVEELEVAVDDGLLDAEQGIPHMDDLSAAARQMADTAVNQATAQGGDPDSINEAQQYMLQGDQFRQNQAFKDAVNKYKDALAKAESVL